MTIPAALIEAAAEAMEAKYNLPPWKSDLDDIRTVIAAALAALPTCEEAIDVVGRAVWVSSWGDVKFPTEPGSDRYFVDVTTEDVLAALAEMGRP